jgi:hypothetical protein
MLILYTLQVSLGLFIHFVKFRVRWPGGRAPQNYLHVVIGITLLGLASFQVHFGMTHVWPTTPGVVHRIPRAAMSAWLVLITVRFASPAHDATRRRADEGAIGLLVAVRRGVHPDPAPVQTGEGCARPRAQEDGLQEPCLNKGQWVLLVVMSERSQWWPRTTCSSNVCVCLFRCRLGWL